MMQIVLNVSEEEARCLTERAHAAGYETVEAYLRALANIEVSPAETEDEDVPGRYDPVLAEQFKQAFKQALRGEVMSKEELWRRLAKGELFAAS